MSWQEVLATKYPADLTWPRYELAALGNCVGLGACIPAPQYPEGVLQAQDGSH